MADHRADVDRHKRVMRTLVNIGQAATIAGVSRRTIYNWMTDGRIEFTRTPTGGARIYRDSLFQNAETNARAPIRYVTRAEVEEMIRQALERGNRPGRSDG